MPSLLTTKLHIPPLRSADVRRPQLAAWVGRTRLTLISAPAGYGKTTLAAERLWQVPKNQRAWLTLDADDNDPVRLTHYLIATLKPILAISKKLELNLELRDLLDTLMNALAGVTAPIFLVLDDYQIIETPATHQLLGYLIQHCPPQLRLILTTRTDPPLPLAQLRARDQLTEIRVPQLKFTTSEVRSFLSQTMQLKLTEAEAVTLENRTEGWVAGLQLVALSLLDGTESTSFMARFSGQDRHIADYLLDEVFTRQPAEIQSFLLYTCILQRLSAPLGALLTQSEVAVAQSVLERLDRNNLFLIPLDRERRWYRYHPLFTEFLYQRLQTTQPELVGTLRAQAAQWLAEHNELSAAIDQLLAIPDFETAARLLDSAAPQWIEQGEFATLLAKLIALPNSWVRQRPNLCTWLAWALVLSDRWAEAEPWLTLVERHYLDLQRQAQSSTNPRDARLWNYRAGYGQALAIRATIALQQQAYDTAEVKAKEALALLPRNDLVLPSAMALILGQVCLARGALAEAVVSLKQALADSQAVGHSYIYVNALLSQARAEQLQGQRERAQWLVQQALQVTQAKGLLSLLRLAEQAQRTLTTTGPTLLLEPLNTRELEIVRLLERGLPNQAIAAELMLATSTVRWHVKHLYRKLGTHNRAQAAHRARELGLV